MEPAGCGWFVVAGAGSQQPDRGIPWCRPPGPPTKNGGSPIGGRRSPPLRGSPPEDPPDPATTYPFNPAPIRRPTEVPCPPKVGTLHAQACQSPTRHVRWPSARRRVDRIGCWWINGGIDFGPVGPDPGPPRGQSAAAFSTASRKHAKAGRKVKPGAGRRACRNGGAPRGSVPQPPGARGRQHFIISAPKRPSIPGPTAPADHGQAGGRGGQGESLTKHHPKQVRWESWQAPSTVAGSPR